MKKIAFVIVVVATLLLSTAAWAEETPANQQVRPQTERPRERVQNLTPEERAQLREKWQNMSAEERAQFRARMRENAGGERPGPEAAQRAFANELAAFKKQYELTRGELQAIRQLALKEKATQTTKALEKLMARHEEQYQRQLKVLQQRLERLQAAQKAAEGQQVEPNQPQPADRPATPSDKQADKSSPAKLK